MVVVVPTLAQAQYAKNEVVPALVAAVKRAGSPQVTDRVDAPRDVMPQADANKTTPEKTEQGSVPRRRYDPSQNSINKLAKDHPNAEKATRDVQ